MNKNTKIAIVVCIFITAAAFIGSTGLFYSDFRPIRNRDLFAYIGAWAWLFYIIISENKKAKNKNQIK